MAVMATLGQHTRLRGLTEPGFGDSFKSARDNPKNEHVLEVPSASLGDEEGTPEEDLPSAHDLTQEQRTYIDGEILGQGELGHEKVTRDSPDEPTDVEDGREGRVLGTLETQVFSDTEERGIG
jgi:hypothetical protein